MIGIELPEDLKDVKKIQNDTDLSSEDLKDLTTLFKRKILEQTGKKWKKIYLWSMACFVLSIMLMITARGGQNTILAMVSPLLFIAAIVLYIRARFGVWWHHG